MTSYPQAIWRPGPDGANNGGTNACHGVVLHSMVGSFDAAMSRLDSGAVSWHYSVKQDGQIFSHNLDEEQCWHSGTARNNDLLSIEHEGGPPGNESEPLTSSQLEASNALVRWLAQAHGFPRVLRVGLWEHNWLYPTACPSGRIPWEHYTEEEDEGMNDEVKAAIGELLKEQGALGARLDAILRSMDELTKDLQNLGGLCFRLQERLNKAGIA